MHCGDKSSCMGHDYSSHRIEGQGFINIHSGQHYDAEWAIC